MTDPKLEALVEAATKAYAWYVNIGDHEGSTAIFNDLRTALTAIEPSPEPSAEEVIHSGGRCTCSGEGRCAWCRELAASENRAAVPICKCGYLLVRGLCQYARCSEYKAPPGGSKP